jgi:hypothetical protein
VRRSLVPPARPPPLIPIAPRRSRTHIRHIRRPVRRMRQGPLHQAATRGGRESPPDPSLGRPFRPHNLGSCLARAIAPFPSPFISYFFLPVAAPGHRCPSYLPRLPWEPDRSGHRNVLPQRDSDALRHENVRLSCGDSSVRSIHRMSIQSTSLHAPYAEPDRALSCIGAISSGMRASRSSLSPSFYISPTSVCPPVIIPHPTLTPLPSRYRGRGSLHPDPHRR